MRKSNTFNGGHVCVLGSERVVVECVFTLDFGVGTTSTSWLNPAPTSSKSLATTKTGNTHRLLLSAVYKQNQIVCVCVYVCVLWEGFYG